MSTFRAEINTALKHLLGQRKDIVLIGQSIRDPYGGACKVTRGLTRHHNNRIFDAPISEAGMIGWATGLAMRGYIPIVEIMFMDFLTLCADQVINIALKMPMPIKVLIRTMHNPDEMYGPTHSQYMRVLNPYVRIIHCFDGTIPVLEKYNEAIERDEPVIIMLESKDLYGEEPNNNRSW